MMNGRMRRLYKGLVVCLLVSAVALALVEWGRRGLVGGRSTGATSLRMQEANEVRQNLRISRRTDREVDDLLGSIILPEVDFENLDLPDALARFNELIMAAAPADMVPPRILPDPSLLRVPDAAVGPAIDGAPLALEERRGVIRLRVSNVPANVALRYICDAANQSYWIYKGDVFVGLGDACRSCALERFWSQERFERIALDSRSEQQLVGQLNQLIDQHEYFGVKTRFSIRMSERARAALENGQVQMPAVRIDMPNATLNEALLRIAEESRGLLVPADGELRFLPFGEEADSSDPFAPPASAQP